MMLVGVAMALAASLAAARPDTTSAPCDSAPSGVVETARDSASVLRVELAWVRAIEQRDANAVACILADDFLDTSWQGVLRSKQDELDGFSRPLTMVQHFQDWRVKVYGATAVVRGLNVVSDSTGRELTRLRFTDVYAYRDGRWRAVAAQETPVMAGRS
jgi:ketosteroid isomerase-like protein